MVISPDSKNPRSHKNRNSPFAHEESGSFPDARRLTPFHFRSKFRAMKNTFAGRSPNRRMKYGYHSVPNGT